MMNKIQIVAGIGEILRKEDDFLITSHFAPDGDNIGSCAGMYHALTSIGKKAVIVNEDGFVERFRYLFGKADLPFVKYSEKLKKKFGNVIILDTATFERIGKVKELIKKDACIINIDHHPANTNFGTVNLVDEQAASAAQIVFSLLEKNNFPMDKKISNALLSGLLSDTGGLRFANTDKRALRDSLNMMKYGSDIAELNDRIFMRLSYDETVKVNRIVSETQLFRKEKIAITYNDQQNDPLIENEPVLMALSSIEEAEIAVFIRKTDKDRYKLSLRSKGGFDVNKFSSKWGGGGHRNASGIRFEGTYEKLLKDLIGDLKRTALEYYA
ncbi:MAG: bifunctional oligoribonuclease/PAP phosphatase NrnA [Anaerolineaceae bacterium]|nr:bifunctional oligoribonuclease/PAP phosphatase NrnA [Anaerolineaceae bacterium]